MLFSTLSDYINANAPMTNLPELLNLHHSNPLGLHPIVIPIILLLLALGMHIVTCKIYYKNRHNLYPLLYALVSVTVVATYYYCFSGDLPLYRDKDLQSEEICIGWFCQQDIVGLGWAIVGIVLLSFTVYCFLKSLMQMTAHLNETLGVKESIWREWTGIVLTMLVGASVAGVVDNISPITGVWIMLLYQLVIIVLTLVKLGLDIARTHNPGRCILATVCFFIGFEAVTMLTIECIEGIIYLFIPIVSLFATVDFLHKKRVS